MKNGKERVVMAVMAVVTVTYAALTVRNVFFCGNIPDIVMKLLTIAFLLIFLTAIHVYKKSVASKTEEGMKMNKQPPSFRENFNVIMVLGVIAYGVMLIWNALFHSFEPDTMFTEANMLIIGLCANIGINRAHNRRENKSRPSGEE
jgi:amino acid transporter